MPKRTPLDWEDLERELHAAGVSPEEIDAGARQLLAQARGHQLAETRKQLGLGQKQIATSMGVSVARVSQIEHGEFTSFEVIARYVEALGAAWTSSPISATGPSGCPSATPQRPHDSNRGRQLPPHTSRLSRQTCDSALPSRTMQRQADHRPCTCQARVAATRDGHLVSIHAAPTISVVTA